MCFVHLCNEIKVRCCSSEENWKHGLEQSNLFSIPLGRGSVEHSFPASDSASCPWPKNHNRFLWVDGASEQHESLLLYCGGGTKRCACTLWCTTLVLVGQLVRLHNWIESDGNSNQLSFKILSLHHAGMQFSQSSNLDFKGSKCSINQMRILVNSLKLL